MTQARKLAAIMAVDVVGYSRAAEQDEIVAVESVSKLKHVLSEIAQQHGGRLFNTAGDGLMLEFPTASAGLAAAQRLLKREDLPSVRVGLHLGEVIVEGHDLLGHGVNVAARLQQMADPGVAMISQTMRAQAHPDSEFHVIPCGRIRLAKMSETISVYALTATEKPLSSRLRWSRARSALLGLGLVAFLLLAGAAAFGIRSLQPTEFGIGAIDLIVRSSDVEVHPSLSPDGRFLVYAASVASDASLDLYLRSTAGGEAIRLTDTPEYDELAPAWSPNADRVAYVRAHPSATTMSDEPCVIIMRVVPDGEEREIGTCEGRLTTRLSWSPTQERLLFADRPTDVARSRLLELDIATGEVTELLPGVQEGNDFNASYSPDGRRVVFVRYALSANFSGRVMVFDRASGVVRSITDRNESQAFVAWAPDGRSVLVAANLSGNQGLSTDLWQLRANGRGQPVRLGLPDAWRLSQEGGLLAFEIRRRKLNVVRLSNGRETLLTSGEQLDFDPDFSEEGSLAFTSAINGTWLFVQHRGAELRRVVQLDVTAARGLRWGPSGREVAVIGETEARAGIFVTDVATGRTREIPTPGLSPTNLDWANDGRSVVFGATDRTGSRLWRVELGGGSAPQAISDYGWDQVIESPDGFFGTPTGGGDIAAGVYRLDRDGWTRLTPEVEMAGRPALASTALGLRGWTIQHGRLYYLYASNPRTTTLYERALSGDRAATALSIAPGLVVGLTVDTITGDAAFRRLTSTDADIGIARLVSE